MFFCEPRAGKRNQINTFRQVRLLLWLPMKYSFSNAHGQFMKSRYLNKTGDFGERILRINSE